VKPGLFARRRNA